MDTMDHGHSARTPEGTRDISKRILKSGLLNHTHLVEHANILLMLSATVVRLAHGRRVVGEEGVTIVTVVLRHRYLSYEKQVMT